MVYDELTKGTGRTTISLRAGDFGADLLVYVCNQNAHLGAVAVGEWDNRTGRVSTSVITLLGHKDDEIARRAAYRLAKSLKRPVCAVAGVHVDSITKEEIVEILANVDDILTELTDQISDLIRVGSTESSTSEG